MNIKPTKPSLSANFSEKLEKKLDGKKIYVLMGASGSGKTTIGNYLKELGLPEIISHTTRPKREGEVDGVTYYYVTKEEFDKIEKVEQVQYGENFYCISKAEIDNKLNASDRLFVICDVNGMEQVKAHYPDEVVVIYLYTSLKEMKHRMKKRGDSIENIKVRIQYAKKTQELDNGKYADFKIKNRDLKKTKRIVRKIIQL